VASIDPKVDAIPVEVTHNHSTRGGVPHNEVVEVFEFRPTLTAADGNVRLVFRRESPPQTFLTRFSQQQDDDFVSFQPFEPIKQLNLVIEFHEFAPPTTKARAIYGPGGHIMDMETLTCNRKLQQSRDGMCFRVALPISYPVLGVSYRVLWRFRRD
jgi:hypothetical protein